MDEERSAADFAQLTREFEQGATLHGNREGALAAERERVVFGPGDYCIRDCGTLVREQLGTPAGRMMRAHFANADACWKHPLRQKKKEVQ